MPSSFLKKNFTSTEDTVDSLSPVGEWKTIWEANEASSAVLKDQRSWADLWGSAAIIILSSQSI